MRKKDPTKVIKIIDRFLNGKSKSRQELIQQLKHYHQGPDSSVSLTSLSHSGLTFRLRNAVFKQLLASLPWQ